MASNNPFMAVCSWYVPTALGAAGTITWFLLTSLLSRVRPGLYLDDLYVSSLNKTLDFNKTTTIHFDLRIENKNHFVGLYYEDPVNLTFTYIPPTDITTNPNLTTAKYTIPGFYQGNGKVKHVQDFVVVHDFFSVVDQYRRALKETTHGFLMGAAKVVVFRVDLDVKIKFKSIESKKCDLVAGALVEVNGDTGNIIQKRSAELEYASGSDEWEFVQWLICIPMYLLMIIVITAIFLYVPYWMLNSRFYHHNT